MKGNRSARGLVVTDPGGIRDWLVAPAFVSSNLTSHTATAVRRLRKSSSYRGSSDPDSAR